MRKSFILGSLAAVALGVGGLSGVARAGTDSGPDPRPAPGAPTTVPVGGNDAMTQLVIDTFQSMGIALTPNQASCVAGQVAAGINTSDQAALMALLQQCGISLDQATGGTGAPTAPTAPGVPTTLAVPIDLGALDPATVSAVFSIMGLDFADLACIAAGVTPGVVTDDVGAVAILRNCGLTLVGLLNGLAQFGVGADGVPPSTIAGTPAGGTAPVATNDMMTQLFIDTFESMGMTLTPQQASCLATQAGAGVNTSDQAALMALLQQCGIDITQLVGG